MFNRHLYLIMRGILPFPGRYNFSTSMSLRNSNYYAALGIGQGSTQSEIKSAYYKLSMLYHPDKNKGCEMSAKKFREISQAYEVLGNYRLRKLYDKGIIHTAGSTYARQTDYETEVEDDPETKFYKSRLNKSNVSTGEGRTPIYDFDEWSRAHYGNTFQRRQESQAKYQRKQALKRDHALVVQNEILFIGLIIVIIGMLSICYSESQLDSPKTKKQSTQESLESALLTNDKSSET